MEFKLNFSDLEELQKLLNEVSESIYEFEEAFSNIIDEITENSDGEAIGKIDAISYETMNDIKLLAGGYLEQSNIATQYIDGIREINEDKTGVFELDTSEAKGYIQDVNNQLDKIESLSSETPSTTIFTSSYDSKVNEYNNVEATINLEKDYEDDEATKSLIRSKRVEINNYISNYNTNQVQLTDAQDLLTTLNTSMSTYIEELADYKEIIENLKDFEAEFNPGYWDKHPMQAKVANLDTTIVEELGNNLILDDLTESEWYADRHEIIEKLLADNDLEAEAFYAADGLISPLLGFEYDEVGDYYYTNDTSIQSKFGFLDEFDHIGPSLGMDLNTEIVIFSSGTSEYRLQLWKGEYGYDNAYGAEVALYSRPASEAIESSYNEGKRDSFNIQYDALPEEEQIDIKSEIYDLDGNLLLTNDTAKYEDNHYWNLAIQTTEYPNAKNNLHTRTTLTIEDDEFRDDLYEALSRENDLSNVHVDGNQVIFIWN